MPNINPSLPLYPRKTLDQITKVPKDIISVYVVEQHIWSNKGTENERADARRNRIAESQTVEEFLIDPVRSFLVEFFRLLSAPYYPDRRDMPIGQGYWIQAEFGSGKSHLLSFIGALALGNETEWNIVKQKEEKAGRGKRESLYEFYDAGLAKKTKDSKGVLVAVKTLVGQGNANTGLAGGEKTLADYILDAVGEAYFAENGRSIPLYPTEILAERFLTNDLERYKTDLQKYLQDPTIFDEEHRVSLEEFLVDLQNRKDPKILQDCGRTLWDFYRNYLKVMPDIPIDSEPKLEFMMKRILEEGYAGLLLILDEVSLYMKGRTEAQRAEDESVLVVLSNRLAKVKNLPIWTICSAQQALENTQAGVRNIIADDRLKLVALLNKEDSYYDIALSRVREITDLGALDHYFEDYKRSFSWPQNLGRDEFNRFFPFYPPSIDIVRAVSYKLTTIRSALSFMLETIKSMRIKKSDELITHWSLFDDVVNYSEDPSGTNRSIVAIRTKFTEPWNAYEEACRQINASSNPLIRTYRSRCEKIVKTLFLYHVANISPDGLTSDELMNSVMEWKDHDTDRRADLQDNKDHYENLLDKLDLELAQVEKAGKKFKFNEKGVGIDASEVFKRARAKAEQSELERKNAWHQLLSLNGWPIQTNFMMINLARDIKSFLCDIAPEGNQDVTVNWHNREINGRVYMRDLRDIAHNNRQLPNINSADTGLDFSIFISSTPAVTELDKLVKEQKDPRVLYWTPAPLTPAEEDQLLDFAAYRDMVKEYSPKDTNDAKIVMDYVQGHLAAEIGAIYRIVTGSYSRGRIAAQEYSDLAFNCAGELPAMLSPLVVQVLDSVYNCNDMNFPPPSAFNDLNAVNVINGIVRQGEFPRGVHPSKEVSASQNFGFALGIMVHPNDKKLNLTQCKYTKNLLAWIEEKTHGLGTSVNAETIYKNFMGINGPGAINYGLSKRMVQLYLLCLARDGRIRITLTGRNQPVEAIDYTNMSTIDFRVATLDAFDQVQALKPPEGWSVLAPFASILLEDESVKNIREDADIQKSVLRLMDWQIHSKASFSSLSNGLSSTLSEFGLANPITEHLDAWKVLLNSEIDPSETVACWRNALQKAFGYPVYEDEEVRSQDTDDLTSRVQEIKNIQLFFNHDAAFRSAMQYLHVQLPEHKEFDELRRTLAACSEKVKNLADWMRNESLLMSEFITPMNQAIETYRVRYLQLFDQVVTHTEETRLSINALSDSNEFKALSLLATVNGLGADPCPQLIAFFDRASISAEFFPADLTRAVVERDLMFTPLPAKCPLTLNNHRSYIDKADRELVNSQNQLNNALHEKARLLLSPALTDRLAQGKDNQFVNALIKCHSVEEITEFLVNKLNEPGAGEFIQTLNKYLKKITIVKVKMSDFHPTKHTLEKSDLAGFTQEFETFLSDHFSDQQSDDQTTIIEIE